MASRKQVLNTCLPERDLTLEPGPAPERLPMQDAAQERGPGLALPHARLGLNTNTVGPPAA